MLAEHHCNSTATVQNELSLATKHEADIFLEHAAAHILY